VTQNVVYATTGLSIIILFSFVKVTKYKLRTHIPDASIYI